MSTIALIGGTQIVFYFAAEFWNIISFPNFIAFPNDACPKAIVLCVP